MPARRGDEWEARAAQLLEQRGLTVLARGYRCRLGELDLVCHDTPHLVIVEVRARSRTAVCSAIESVGPAKRRRIILATRHFLLRHPEWGRSAIRFDVVAFEGIEDAEPEFNWIKNAFETC